MQDVIAHLENVSEMKKRNYPTILREKIPNIFWETLSSFSLLFIVHPIFSHPFQIFFFLSFIFPLFFQLPLLQAKDLALTENECFCPLECSMKSHNDEQLTVLLLLVYKNLGRRLRWALLRLPLNLVGMIWLFLQLFLKNRETACFHRISLENKLDNFLSK